jgi:hypothetical protein
VTASKVASLGEMPLNKKLKRLHCRTGNHMLFHFFHLRHRLPGSAARIISQNFASCRLACSFKATLFFVFNPITSFSYQLAWVKMGCGIFKDITFTMRKQLFRLFKFKVKIDGFYGIKNNLNVRSLFEEE